MHPLKQVTQILIAASLLTLAACNQSPELDSDILAQADILNLLAPEPNIMSSGQPSQEQFQVLADSGVKHIINLRPPVEMDFDEGALVESLGMQYHSIPVAVTAGITRENAQSLYDLLEDLSGEPVVIHCASGQRVGALIALSAQQNQGMDAEAAMEEGRRWGLSSPRLTPVVRTLLAETL
ncbi:MAG: protein tyrosine phosphatase family protein [Gammaproteobacteria bacterium]|nr:protein tyrosine phosphatase family protein [Pseudomonadales bacterium]MCP5349179.1 protein tyrosine phosphatase family protein [Pseudomonadales bacterium]